MDRLDDGMRAIIHLVVMTYHYLGFFVANPYKVVNETSIPVRYLCHVGAMYCFSVTFVINGINSGRWLIRQSRTQSSFMNITFKFYWQRLSKIILITYIYYMTVSMANLFIFKSHLLAKLMRKSFWSNLLFLSNFLSIESNVRIHEIVINFVIFSNFCSIIEFNR